MLILCPREDGTYAVYSNWETGKYDKVKRRKRNKRDREKEMRKRRRGAREMGARITEK